MPLQNDFDVDAGIRDVEKTDARVDAMVAEDTSALTSSPSPSSNTIFDVDAGLSDVEAELAKDIPATSTAVGTGIPPKKRSGEGLLNDIIVGGAESTAGINRKLAAISKLVDTPLIDTDMITNNLSENAKYLETVAKVARGKADGNWLVQAVAAAPATFLEFMPAGSTLRGAVAVGGVLSALDEYGRSVINDEKIKPGQVVMEGLKGAGLMAATGGAFKALGVSMEKLAPLLPKYGYKAMNKVLKEIGVPEAEIPKTIQNIKDYLPGGKAYKKPGELAKEQGEEIKAIKDLHEEELWKEKNFGIGRETDIKLDEIRQETAREVAAVSDANRIALERLAEKRKQIDTDAKFNKQVLDVEDRNTIVGTQAVHDAKLAEAEKELYETVGTVFGNKWKLLDTYKGKIDDIVDTQLTSFFRKAPLEGPKTELVGRNIATALNSGRLVDATWEKGVMQLSPKKGLTEPNLVASVRNLEGWLNGFLKADEEGSIRTLQNLKYTHDKASELVGAELRAGGVHASLGGDLDLIKSALDPVKYIDDISPEASKFFGKLKEDLAEYGHSKDLMTSWEKVLFKDTAAGPVPRVKEIFGWLESPTGKEGIKLIEDLERRSPPGMSILKEVREMKAGFDAIKKAQADRLSQMQMQIEASAKNREIDIRRAIAEVNKQEALLGDTAGLRAVKDEIRGIQAKNRAEMTAAREALEVKLRDLKKGQAAYVSAREKRHAEEMADATVADTLRSWRPKQGVPRVLQSLGIYGSVGGGISALASGSLVGAAPVLAAQALTAYAMSPIAMARAFEWGIRNKSTIKAVAKRVEKAGSAIDRSKTSRLIQQLIATSPRRHSR